MNRIIAALVSIAAVIGSVACHENGKNDPATNQTAAAAENEWGLVAIDDALDEIGDGQRDVVTTVAFADEEEFGEAGISGLDGSFEAGDFPVLVMVLDDPLPEDAESEASNEGLALASLPKSYVSKRRNLPQAEFFNKVSLKGPSQRNSPKRIGHLQQRLEAQDIAVILIKKLIAMPNGPRRMRLTPERLALLEWAQGLIDAPNAPEPNAGGKKFAALALPLKDAQGWNKQTPRLEGRSPAKARFTNGFIRGRKNLPPEPEAVADAAAGAPGPAPAAAISPPKVARPRLMTPKLQSDWERSVADAYAKSYPNAPQFDITRTIDGKKVTVNRPNHGTAHAMRKAQLAKDALALIAQGPKSNSTVASLNEMNEADVNFSDKIAFAASFTRAGREGEDSSNQGDYDRSAVIFRAKAKSSGLFSNDAEIEAFARAIQQKPNGANETAIDAVLQSAHQADLVRLYPAKGIRFPATVAGISGFHNGMVKRSAAYLKATGNRHLEGGQKDYMPEFYRLSNNMPALVSAISAASAGPF